MSQKKTAIRLAVQFAGQDVPVCRKPWQRQLEFAGGIVARRLWVTVYFAGQRRVAERVADRLRSYGYRVRIKKEVRHAAS